MPTTMSMMIEEEPPAASAVSNIPATTFRDDDDDGPSCCYLSTKDTAKQVPQSDIARISFYLRCCVLGCGLLNNNKNNRIPHQFMDFTSAPSLPLQCQNMIYRLAFEGFPLTKLLNRGIIHIDTHESVLPTGVSTMFLNPNSAEYTEAMNRLRPPVLLPSTYDGNIMVMICSSEWIHNHYILPFQRYNHHGMSIDDRHHHTSSTTILQDSHQSTKQERQERTTSTEEKDLAHVCDVDIDQDDDDDDIPMVAAVPMPQQQQEEDDHHVDDDDDPMMMTTSSQEEEDDEVSSSLIVVGQMVKLIGLEEASEMNDVVGYVVQRINNRLVVDVPYHEAQYSLRVENVMIVLS